MDAKAKQSFIRQKARENQRDPQGNKVLWSQHTIVELVFDLLTRSQVESTLETCEVIEDYLALHRPLPDCLALGWLAPGEPVHAVIAVDPDRDRIFMVTVYRPSAEEWKDDWQTRTS